jgi:hypothetical protein
LGRENQESILLSQRVVARLCLDGATINPIKGLIMKNKTLPLSVCFLLLLAACEIQKTSDSSVNALPINTEMVSSEQSFYPYKEIFPSLDGLSSSTALSGKYVTSFVDAYHGQTQLGTIYTGTASYGQTVNMKIMVGMSTANGKTVLGKVSILNNGATGGFDTTVVANYVTPYNADPSDTTLANVKCGATAAATSIKMIVSEAKDLYESGGTVEDIDGEIKPCLIALPPIRMASISRAKPTRRSTTPSIRIRKKRPISAPLIV